jgi:dihydrofolate synthase/folylpolyglutamate synthase
MSYGSTIDYLYGLQKYGTKFGLDNIRRLTAELGDPQRSYKAVHVAGTNGKGSTSAALESILRTAGVATGLFTSPHLISFTERIRVNGNAIPEDDVVRLGARVRSIAERIDDFSPTFFEVTAAIAFLYFREMRVAWAVTEVGMGGRLDATNIIVPEASVITSIGYDHREFLGNTLREIAGEKAGIIKKGVPVVTAAQEPEALEIIDKKAREAGSNLYTYGRDFSGKLRTDDVRGIRFDYSGTNSYEDLYLGLAGEHQVMNASVAVRASEVVMEKYPGISCDVRKGLSLTTWPGRLEVIKEHPLMILDGAHNPQSAEVLARHIRKIRSRYQRVVLVLGIMGDKDREEIMKPLLRVADEIIFTAPAYSRAASPESLAATAASLGYASKTARTVADALLLAEDLSAEGDLIVISGSFYTIGEAKEALGHKGVLSRLRE